MSLWVPMIAESFTTSGPNCLMSKHPTLGAGLPLKSFPSQRETPSVISFCQKYTRQSLIYKGMILYFFFHGVHIYKYVFICKYIYVYVYVYI